MPFGRLESMTAARAGKRMQGSLTSMNWNVLASLGGWGRGRGGRAVSRYFLKSCPECGNTSVWNVG